MTKKRRAKVRPDFFIKSQSAPLKPQHVYRIILSLASGRKGSNSKTPPHPSHASGQLHRAVPLKPMLQLAKIHEPLLDQRLHAPVAACLFLEPPRREHVPLDAGGVASFQIQLCALQALPPLAVLVVEAETRHARTEAHSSRGTSTTFALAPASPLGRIISDQPGRIMYRRVVAFRGRAFRGVQVFERERQLTNIALGREAMALCRVFPRGTPVRLEVDF